MQIILNVVLFVFMSQITMSADFKCSSSCTRFTASPSKKDAMKECLTNCRSRLSEVKNFMIKVMTSDDIEYDLTKELAASYVGSSPLSTSEYKTLYDLADGNGKARLFVMACSDVSVDLLDETGVKALSQEDLDYLVAVNPWSFSKLFKKRWGVGIGPMPESMEFPTEAILVKEPEDVLSLFRAYKTDSTGRDDKGLDLDKGTLVRIRDRISGKPEFFQETFLSSDKILAKALAVVEKQKRERLQQAEDSRDKLKTGELKLEVDGFLRSALLLHLYDYDLDIFFKNIGVLQDAVVEAQKIQADFWSDFLIEKLTEPAEKLAKYLPVIRANISIFKSTLSKFSNEMKSKIERGSYKTTDAIYIVFNCIEDGNEWLVNLLLSGQVSASGFKGTLQENARLLTLLKEKMKDKALRGDSIDTTLKTVVVGIDPAFVLPAKEVEESSAASGAGSKSSSSRKGKSRTKATPVVTDPGKLKDMQKKEAEKKEKEAKNRSSSSR